jgi:hypothetical protein
VVSNGIYDHEISVPIEIPVVQPHYVITNDIPSEARIKVRGQGMALLTFMLFREGRLELNVDWEPGEKIVYPRLQDVILSGGAHSISVLQLIDPLEITLSIEGTASRILPVNNRIIIKPEPGYTLVGELNLDPMEITVRGPQSLLQNMISLPTDELVLQKIKGPIQGEIFLSSPQPGKIFLQPSQVQYKADIQKLMEKRIDRIQIGVHH